MGAHRWPYNGHTSAMQSVDPGNGGSINVDRNFQYVPLVSTAAQTRTLNRPTRANVRVRLYFLSDGGDITLTVTGGYDAAGSTAYLFTTAGQWVEFVSSINSSGAYVWQIAGTSEVASGAAPQFTSMPAVQTATDTATLTSAQMLGGVLVGTPTAAATYTTLTGALLAAAVAAIRPQLAVGDSFELVIINLGGTTNFDITLAGGVGVSVVGSAVVRPVVDAATEEAGQGVFRFRYAAADTWVAYRVG